MAFHSIPMRPRPHKHLFKLVPLKDEQGYVAKCECGVLLTQVIQVDDKKGK